MVMKEKIPFHLGLKGEVSGIPKSAVLTDSVQWSIYQYIFCGTGIWANSFMLARQALYCLSHASSSFCSGYFGDRFSLFVLTSLDHNSILSFLLSLGWQLCTTTPSFFLLRWGSHKTFCWGWTRTMMLLISAASVAWDGRQAPLHSTISWDGMSCELGLDLSHHPLDLSLPSSK
jgi:hypothetical protein